MSKAIKPFAPSKSEHYHAIPQKGAASKIKLAAEKRALIERLRKVWRAEVTTQ